jgi:hypothetical protein
MGNMADEEGGPDMVSFREFARRAVAEGLVTSMSHQRVSQLHRTDPNFPPVVVVGRSKAVDWRAGRRYLQSRELRPGRRTDLEKPVDGE